MTTTTGRRIAAGSRELRIGTGERWDAALAAWDGRLAPDVARQAAALFERLGSLYPDGSPHLAPEDHQDLPRARRRLAALLDGGRSA